MNQINNPPELFILQKINGYISLFIMNKTHNKHVKPFIGAFIYLCIFSTFKLLIPYK